MDYIIRRRIAYQHLKSLQNPLKIIVHRPGPGRRRQELIDPRAYTFTINPSACNATTDDLHLSCCFVGSGARCGGQAEGPKE